MKNASREVSRFYVEVMDDSKMNSQTAVLTITDNDLLIEGEQTLSILRTQIRKVQRFLNAGLDSGGCEIRKTTGKRIGSGADCDRHVRRRPVIVYPGAQKRRNTSRKLI